MPLYVVLLTMCTQISSLRRRLCWRAATGAGLVSDKPRSKRINPQLYIAKAYLYIIYMTTLS